MNKQVQPFYLWDAVVGEVKFSQLCQMIQFLNLLNHVIIQVQVKKLS